MDVFHIFLAVMTGIAVIVFVALYFVKAGYGMFFDAKWGRPINNRIGWVLMLLQYYQGHILLHII